MDAVQWYYTTLLIIGIICNMMIHGHPKEGVYDFRMHFVALILSIPVAGRVFHFW